MLSERRQKVLQALIEEYIAYASPVGSRTLVERYKLGISSATVRNELSVLEEGGYVVQPHTSAGRIPTDFGYRAFVDNLLNSDMVFQDQEDTVVVDELKKSAKELDSLLDKTSYALARLTDCLSLVLAPSILALHIKQITLVALSEHRVLVVVITEDGQVLNRTLEIESGIDLAELSTIQNLLNNQFVGKSFSELRDQAPDADTMEALQQPLTRVILEEILLSLSEHATGKAHHLGVSSLMKKPEFSNSETLLPVVQALEEDTILLRIFDKATQGEGPVVTIGQENDSKELSSVSVVAGKYGRGDAAGVVAVIGPTRMDYSKVIQAVHIAQSALKDV